MQLFCIPKIFRCLLPNFKSIFSFKHFDPDRIPFKRKAYHRTLINKVKDNFSLLGIFHVVTAHCEGVKGNDKKNIKSLQRVGDLLGECCVGILNKEKPIFEWTNMLL